jgi:hypothetical protein
VRAGPTLDAVSERHGCGKDLTVTRSQSRIQEMMINDPKGFRSVFLRFGLWGRSGLYSIRFEAQLGLLGHWSDRRKYKMHF